MIRIVFIEYHIKLLEFKKIIGIKLNGKIATYCEQREHGINAPLIQIVEEVIPDLLSHSLRLANLTEKDLEVLYKNRLKGLKEKLKY